MIDSDTVHNMIIDDIFRSFDNIFQGICYHYTSPEGFIGIINSGDKIKFWFSRYDGLNDTQERLDLFQSLKRYAEKRYGEKRIPEEFYRMLIEISDKKELDKNIFSYQGKTIHYLDENLNERCTNSHSKRCQSDTYICSFSLDRDSLPMWNYYSKSRHYEGYSVGIQYMDMFLDVHDKGYRIGFYKVLYSDEEKFELFDEFIIKWMDTFNDTDSDGKKQICEYVKEQILSIQYVFKNEHFAHEREVRAVLQIPQDSTIPHGMTVKYRAGNGYIIPYIEYEIPRHLFQSVTVAPLLEKELAKKNVEELLKNRGYVGDVYSSEIPIRF